MTTLRFVLCDVFTDKPLAGQTLAVFTRATGVSDERMQALAREFSAGETAFVQPPTAGGQVKLRVFGPNAEVFASGHAALGTAVVLGGALQAEVVRLETHGGPVSVRLEREGARIVFGWVQEPLPAAAAFGAGAALLGALGLAGALPPSDVSETAAGQLVVALSAAEFAELAPEPARLRSALAELGVARLSVFAGARGRYQVRVFVPAEPGFEVPVTPQTAAALAAHLLRHERESLDASLVIESGVRLARPSLVHVRIEAAPGSAPVVAVGGAAVVVGRGEIVLRD